MLKRICAFLLLLIIVFTFSGCEVHFSDGTSYDLPWWLVVILFDLPFIILGAILVYVNSPKEFWAYCPKCEERFYVKKRIVRLSSHMPADSFPFIYRCPCCKRKHICYKSWDN